MKIILKYRKKQFFFLFLIFVFFTAIVTVSEYRHEKKYRLNTLNSELNNYSELINNYIVDNSLFENNSLFGLDSLTHIFPDKNIRISIINLKGTVLYDTKTKNVSEMENHFFRPEIQQALAENTGNNIRLSASTGIKYYYFAKRFKHYFVRVSVVYDLEAKQIIEPDKISLFFIIFLFFISSVTLIFFTDKFGKSVSALKEFTIQASTNKPIDDNFTFPENELGNIGQNIVEIYQKLKNSQQELVSEKEKLIRHLNLLEEGIAIFSADKKLISYNNHFIQNLNLISDRPVYSAEIFFEINEFSPLKSYIAKHIKTENTEISGQPAFEINVNKNSKIFSVKCILFQDKSFEILISDATKPAKRKLLKQQITDNIAHELKTPVSSIKGFLETILNNKNKIDEAKLIDFIRRAYSQSCRLADLINDISLLTKIEEAGSLYQTEPLNLYGIIKSVIDDVQLKLDENSVKTELEIGENIQITGNPVLLYSIFRNLFDNSISHAGNNTTIRISHYLEDSENYYFSFSDTGSGVPEQDLPRLFERFYRVDKGRDRKSGGTGLGLAIVKNAVLFHKGEISVKNRKEGGLEFLFSIGKNVDQSQDENETSKH